MVGTDREDAVVVLGTETQRHVGGSGHVASPLAAIMVVAAVILGLSLVTKPSPLPPDPDLPERRIPVDEEMVVFGTTQGLTVLDPRSERMWHIALDVPPIGIASGDDATVVVHDESGAVTAIALATSETVVIATDVVWFSPSAEPGRFWIRERSDPTTLSELDASGTRFATVARSDDPAIDPRLGTEPEGTHSLAFARHIVVGEVCTAERCRLAVSRISPEGRIASEDGWTPIAPSPSSLANLRVSGNGRWILAGNETLGLYRVDRGGVRRVYPTATDAAFTDDSERLYVLMRSALDVVDLEGTDVRSISTTAGRDATTHMVVV